MVWSLIYNNSRNRDLAMVSQARELATGLENYFDKTNNYPEIAKTKLANIQVLTENGLNQEGTYKYFEKLDWSKNGTIVSNKEQYAIEFELDNSWALWNLNGGGKCRISNNLNMACLSK